jgi:hypothetical protein
VRRRRYGSACAPAPVVAPVVALVVALGCAWFAPACRTPALRVTGIPVAEAASFELLPPSALGQSVELELLVAAQYGAAACSLHCWLDIDAEADQLVLVARTPLDARVFKLELSDQALSIDVAPGARLPADPTRILADLQLALWPDPTVRGLERVEILGHGSPTGGSMWREFRRHGSAVVRVYYDAHSKPGGPLWGELLSFEQLEQHVTLKVETLRAE